MFNQFKDSINITLKELIELREWERTEFGDAEWEKYQTTKNTIDQLYDCGLIQYNSSSILSLAFSDEIYHFARKYRAKNETVSWTHGDIFNIDCITPIGESNYLITSNQEDYIKSINPYINQTDLVKVICSYLA